MKGYSLLLLLATAILFSSCGKDFSESVIGTWDLSRIDTQDGCDEPELVDLAVDNNGCFDFDGTKLCISFVISENGMAQGVQSEDGEEDTVPLTYTVNNDTEEITLCEGTGPDDCNVFKKSGGNLIWTTSEDGCALDLVFEKN